MTDERPKNTKDVFAVGNFGVDPKGESCFFTLQLSEDENDKLHLGFSADGLRIAIDYLQHIAHLAQQRRIASSPVEAGLAQNKKRHSVVHAIEFGIDPAGESLLFQCTQSDGTPLNIEMPYLVAKGLSLELPNAVAVVEQNRQHARAKH
jgi:hypothetical protein